MTVREQAWAGIGLFVLLLACGLLLRPGIGGTFVFDDYPNLMGLAAITAEPSLERALHYVLNGLSSTLGRPLALATFVAQHASWPYATGDFIRWNILLHLANGALLLLVLVRLQGTARPGLAPGPVAALALVALWLCAPIQASAVLYVVQRMTVLAGTCTLAGVALYLVGRAHLEKGRLTRGYALSTLAVAVGLGAGTLAKESAALFPLLLLVLEATVLRPFSRDAAWRWWRLVCVLAPLALLAGYLALQLPTFAQTLVFREFTLAERLLTEFRILFGYLYKILVPPAATIRILHDDIVLSRSLLEPWTTLASVGAWLLLLAAALRWRERAPVPAFAVLWFLACHALESSVVPLELAFDHRNYVALLGPVAGLVWVFDRLARWPAAARLRRALPVAAFAYGVAVAVSLHATAELWGHPVRLARYWLETQPESGRAYHQYAEILVERGKPEEAIRAYQRAVHRWPHNPAPRLCMLELGCYLPSVETVDMAALRTAFRQPEGNSIITLNVLLSLIRLMETGRCPRYAAADIAELARLALEAPAFAGQRHNVYMMNSRMAEVLGDREKALDYLHYALGEQIHLPNLRQAVLWELQAGHLDIARALVAIAEHSDRISWRQRWIHRKDIAELRALVDGFAASAEPAP